MKTSRDEFRISNVKSLLKEALPPQPDPVYWKHPLLERAITAGSINMISTDSASKSLQLSLQIASAIALTKAPVVPTRGVNPFTGINESEDYDAVLAEQAQMMPVLYLNTIAADAQLERELVLALPDMLKWIWVDRDQGAEYPYEAMRMHHITAQPGTIMKEENKRALTQYITQNKIKFVVLNSFEFACRTQREKDDLACLIKELRDVNNVAVLVFTHESESRLKTIRRGPLSMIAMLSTWIDSVATLAPEIKDRTIEYIAPASAGIDAEPVYRGTDEVNAAMKEMPTEVLIDAMSDELPDTACIGEALGRSKLTWLDHNVIRNGGSPTITKSV